MLTILTKDLKKKIEQTHKLNKYRAINPRSFTEIFNVLKKENKKELTIYDITYSKQDLSGEVFQVNDHINQTGTNILIGKQKQTKTDFIDLTNLYKQSEKGIITTCYGSKIKTNAIYPSHFLCNISILAKAMKFKSIYAYLINYKCS